MSAQSATAGIVVAGGGTAGHVFPAIAVMQGLVDAGVDRSHLHYMGAKRGVETSLIPQSGFDGTFVSVTGISRKLSVRSLKFVTQQFLATMRSLTLFRRWNVRAVVSVGGYASLPAVIAAVITRRPIIVVSYDRTPGRASRLAARWSTVTLVAFEKSPLRRAVVAGAPLRRSILTVDRSVDADQARQRLGVPDGRMLVVVMGGSLGSGILNDAVHEFLETHSSRDDLAVLHIAGKQRVSGPSERNGDRSVWYRRSEFVAQAEDLYAAADVFVGRGGASTVHEVAATGTPAVLVPWSGASEDHQVANVRWLSDSGGAILVPDNDVDAVIAALSALLDDEQQRSAIGTRAREIGEVHHSGEISRQILDAIR